MQPGGPPGGFNPGGGVSGQGFPDAKEWSEVYVRGIFKAIDPTEKLTKAINDLANRINGGDGLKGAALQADKTGAALKGMSVAGVAASLSLVEGIKGFVRAGLEGTGTAAMLAFQTQMLARNIAAVFLPAIQTVTEMIRRLSEWFRSLSLEQQNAIQGMVVGLAVAKAAASALGAVLGPVGVALGVVAGIIAGVATGSEKGGEILDKLGDAFSGLMQSAKPALDALSDAFESMVGVVSDVLPVFGSIGEVLRPLAEFVGRQLAERFKYVGDIIQKLAPLFEPLFKAIGELITAWDELDASFGSVMEDIKPLIEWIAVKLVEGLKIAIQAIMGAIVALKVMWEHLRKGNISPTELLADIERGIKEVQERAAAGPKAGRPGAPGRKLEIGVGSFEGIGEMFKRVQSAAGETRGAQDKIADNTEKANDKLDKLLEEAKKGNKPAAPPPPPMA